MQTILFGEFFFQPYFQVVFVLNLKTLGMNLAFMKLISRGVMFDWTVSRMLGIVKLIHHSGWRMRSHKIMRIRVSFDLFVFNCLVFTSNRVPCFICFRHLGLRLSPRWKPMGFRGFVARMVPGMPMSHRQSSRGAHRRVSGGTTRFSSHLTMIGHGLSLQLFEGM